MAKIDRDEKDLEEFKAGMLLSFNKMAESFSESGRKFIEVLFKASQQMEKNLNELNKLNARFANKNPEAPQSDADKKPASPRKPGR